MFAGVVDTACVGVTTVCLVYEGCVRNVPFCCFAPLSQLCDGGLKRVHMSLHQVTCATSAAKFRNG